jgi:hypothetical protein
MRHLAILSSCIILAIFVAACGGSKTGPGPTAEEAGFEALYTPPWYSPDSCATTDEYLCQRATMESKDQQLAVTKAAQAARTELQLQMETKLENLGKQFFEEVGQSADADLRAMYTQTSKQVASGVLVGTVPFREEVRRHKETGTFRAWVIYKLMLNNVFLDHLNAIKGNNHMYTRFRQSEAFKDHEKEMEKYEQYKKEQGL